MNRLHLLQLDSVPVVIRTQHMPLYSRLGPHRIDLLDEIAYRDDEWFESWSHEASLLPIEMEPLLRWSKARARQGATWKHLHEMARRQPEYVESVLSEIKARGPLTAGELSDPGPRSSSGWGSRSAGSVALDWLYRIGELGVRRRPGFVKEFDLFERVVPAEVRARPTPSFEESLDALLLRAARAHGVAGADCLVDYFRLPVRPAKARLEILAEEGRLERCRVEGCEDMAYRHPEAKLPRAIRASALLSPFDPVVWNRKRISSLWDFDYRIEIYTPAHKRRYGYYVLPFLMGDRLVGRFDLKVERESDRLQVVAAYHEQHASPTRVAHAAAQELWSLASFLGVPRVAVGRRGNLVGSLRRELDADRAAMPPLSQT